MAESSGNTYDDTLVRDVLAHADIVNIISSYIQVDKRGKNHMALCPFHDDTTPSLTISEEKQIYKCFVCGEGGNAITFVMKYEKIPFYDAVRKVAELSGYYDPRLEKRAVSKPVDEEKEALYKCLEDLTLYYQLALQSEEGTEAMNYLASRGISEDIINKYRIGYAPQDGVNTCLFLQQKGHSLKSMDDTGISVMLGGNPTDKNRGRVIFPICNKDGRVVGYSARTLGKTDEAKYVNTSDTQIFHKSELLYNYHNAYPSTRLDGYLYIVEGFMDVIALEKIGISSAVALMGTALTKEHIALLRQVKVPVRICLDGDKAGLDATLKMSHLLEREGISHQVVNRDGDTRDLDEILSEEGKDALISAVTKLNDWLDFELSYYESMNKLQTSEDRSRLVMSLIPALDSVNDILVRNDYVNKLAAITGFSTKSISDAVNSFHNLPPTQKAHATGQKLENGQNQKALRRLNNIERNFTYEMLHFKEAIEYYNDNSIHFLNTMYREIANYLVDYIAAYPNWEVDYNDIINSIYMSEYLSEEEKGKLISDIGKIYDENRYGNNCSTKLLDDLKKNLDYTRDQINENDMLQNSVTGKSAKEKTRIYSNYQSKRHIDKS